MGFQVYNSQGQELQNLSGTAGGDLTGTYPNPTLAKGPTYETSLPSSPADGQEIYYAADATNGVIWHLRYRSGSSSSYKWEFVGGAALNSSVKNGTISDNETTTSTTYAALTTAGPTITLPLAGDYEVTIGVTGYNGNTSAIIYMSYDIGATGAVDADSVNLAQSNVAANAYATTTKTRVKTGLSAVALTSKYKVSAGTGTLWNRFMIVRPIRVG